MGVRLLVIIRSKNFQKNTIFGSFVVLSLISMFMCVAWRCIFPVSWKSSLARVLGYISWSMSWWSSDRPNSHLNSSHNRNTQCRGNRVKDTILDVSNNNTHLFPYAAFPYVNLFHDLTLVAFIKCCTSVNTSKIFDSTFYSSILISIRLSIVTDKRVI